eukprot:scaffold22649_cov66-Cyclotella_meneghiniana.AAC.11
MAEMDATQQKQKPKKKTREQREQRVKVEGKARSSTRRAGGGGHESNCRRAGQRRKQVQRSRVRRGHITIQARKQIQQKQNRLFSSFGRRDAVAVDGGSYYIELPHRHKQFQRVHHCRA